MIREQRHTGLLHGGDRSAGAHGRGVLGREASRGLALAEPRQGASLRPLTKPRSHKYQWSGNLWAAVEYRGPSGQERTLCYDGRFTDEVGRNLLGLGPEQTIERYHLDPLVRRFMIAVSVFCAGVVILAVVVATLHAASHG
jgi:hypothetical protein